MLLEAMHEHAVLCCAVLCCAVLCCTKPHSSKDRLQAQWQDAQQDQSHIVQGVTLKVHTHVIVLSTFVRPNTQVKLATCSRCIQNPSSGKMAANCIQYLTLA